MNIICSDYMSILSGKSKPHMFTWLVWLATGSIATTAQILAGAGPGAWGNLVMIFGFCVVLMLCPKYGYKKATRSDWVCLAISFGSVPLWLLTDNPLTAVVVVTLIDVIGFVPTIRKTWHEPFSESLLGYGLGALRNVLSLAALESWSFTTALFTATFMTVNILFITVTFIRRLRLSSE